MQAARCIADPRNPLLIKHGVRDMLRQRVYGLALGWEDLSDHGALREDVAMQTAVGVDREVASAPTLCRLEKWADRATAWRLHQVLVDQFIASFKTAPEELVLDFDATDNPLHGQQEGRFFTATTTAIATCRCTCSAASNCCAPTCAPAASMAPSTLRHSQAAGHAAAPEVAPGAHRVSGRLGLLPPAHPELLRARRGALHRGPGAQSAPARHHGIPRTGDEFSAEVRARAVRMVRSTEGSTHRCGTPWNPSHPRSAACPDP
jgi:hypothetical protein